MNVPSRFLLAAAFSLGGLALTPAAHAQRTDSTSTVKPQLNTAPPGTAPRPATPAPRPQQNQQQTPVPAPTPVYEPMPTAPSSDKPSGLDFPVGSRASEQPKPLRKYFLYSNFGLGYSSNPYSGGQFSASLSPSIGYRVSERLAVGPGISYAYNNISFPRDYQAVGLPSSLSLHSIGVKAFLQYIVFDQFFVHAEYEVTKAQSYDIYQVGPQRLQAVKTNRTMNTPLAGAGYRSQLGDRFAADIVLLYNFNNGYDAQGYPLSPYGQPVIRFSFLYDLK
ncbi:hypothetical protein [Hymenobacter psychrotolerans]|uniref:Outer membrane protein beta-barrel domain-containing protein n=1 Tax=Hymenobacter psychrotolerans DSM 18569 TaxID=1121959 RepID=A0A1M6SKL7_9BACT|nr:hypothetical protein [Hymenobacter psychrotolerans]SHK45118.1 hypothetical protein SAMN02746009_00901 [Hymenobacter psychrotolerans DSM 18569]